MRALQPIHYFLLRKAFAAQGNTARIYYARSYRVAPIVFGAKEKLALEDLAALHLVVVYGKGRGTGLCRVRRGGPLLPCSVDTYVLTAKGIASVAPPAREHGDLEDFFTDPAS